MSSEIAFTRDPRDRFTLQAERDFRPALRPVYRNISLSDRRPFHIASSVLLNVDGTRLVSSAAHVIGQIRAIPLYVGGSQGTTLVPVNGGDIWSTSRSERNARLDHFDNAFWVPPPAAIAAMGSVDFLDSTRLSLEDPTPARLYTAIGYPVSRNKKSIDHASSSITTRISMYTANVESMPALAEKLGVSGEDHFFLRFEKRSFSGDGSSANTFGPMGLSGGALLDLGDFSSSASLARDPIRSARLSGIVIEYYPEHRALVAVRISTIVKAIRRALAGRAADAVN